MDLTESQLAILRRVGIDPTTSTVADCINVILEQHKKLVAATPKRPVATRGTPNRGAPNRGAPSP